MEIQDLKPRSGSDTLRIDDSDELVVMENFGMLPKGKLRLNDQGLIVICTEGMAQFDYDGQQPSANICKQKQNTLSLLAGDNIDRAMNT